MTQPTVIDRLFAAIEAHDLDAVRACFAPEARVWHNYDCLAATRGEFLDGLTKLFAAKAVLLYADMRSQPTPSGFVTQYLLLQPAPDGGWNAKPCCMIAHVRDGLIERAEEYLDRGFVIEMAELLAATPGL